MENEIAWRKEGREGKAGKESNKGSTDEIGPNEQREELLEEKGEEKMNEMKEWGKEERKGWKEELNTRESQFLYDFAFRGLFSFNRLSQFSPLGTDVRYPVKSQTFKIKACRIRPHFLCSFATCQLI